MANILYVGSTVPITENTPGAKNAPLTNSEIDKNFYSLNSKKYENTGGDLNGSINIIGVGRKISANFSDNSAQNRCTIQSNIQNGITGVFFTPNGTATQTNVTLGNKSDLGNSSFGILSCSSDKIALRSIKTGTGTILPMVLGSETTDFLTIDTSGNVIVSGNATTSNLTVNNKVYIDNVGQASDFEIGSGSGTGDDTYLGLFAPASRGITITSGNTGGAAANFMPTGIVEILTRGRINTRTHYITHINGFNEYTLNKGTSTDWGATFRCSSTGSELTTNSVPIKINAQGINGITLNTNSTDRLYINGNGDFGFNTTSIGARYHFNASPNDEVARFESTGNAYISLYKSGTRTGYLATVDAGGIAIGVEQSKSLYITTGGLDRFVVDSAGNKFTTVSGSDTVMQEYGLRAYASWDGTMTIRSSPGFSSIIRNSVGSYSLNFITPLPNANYSVTANISRDSGEYTPSDRWPIVYIGYRSIYEVSIYVYNPGTNSYADAMDINITVTL